MRRRSAQHDDTDIALSNFALTLAKAMLVIFAALVMLITPAPKPSDGVKPNMEYMITAQWPGDLNYDVDVWMRDPMGRILYYGNREVGVLNLERDDLGHANDTVVVDGTERIIAVNEEMVAVRGIVPGEYVINVHLYSVAKTVVRTAVPPFAVTVRIDKINPTYRTVFAHDVVFEQSRSEKHVARITVAPDGSVTGRTDLPVRLRKDP